MVKGSIDNFSNSASDNKYNCLENRCIDIVFQKNIITS